jgi:uncharacterized protein
MNVDVQSATMSSPFHVMTKPAGPLCNLDCKYCFYLEKENLYHSVSEWRMPADVLEAYIRQYIESQTTAQVAFAWQGGEPTILGLDFFREVVRLQQLYANGRTIENTLQTNGVTLDDAWGEFLSENRFLVGISVDGPRELHDCYRVDKGGQPTFDRVLRGIEVLQRHAVEFNTLTCVHRKNSYRPLEVYRFLKEAGSRFMQFIPIVERLATHPNADGLVLISPQDPEPARVAPWSVEAGQYGNFLCAIFDEWVRQDVGRYFVQIFDVALESWSGVPQSLCVFSPTCGAAMAMEHNGDLYSCDHFVYPRFRLGNIMEQPIAELASSAQQQQFGMEKQETLPRYCRECSVRFACNGECPKHRFIATPDGEPGLNFLCAAYKHFFQHVDPYMRFMTGQLRQQRAPAFVMDWIAGQEQARRDSPAQRNDPCPCGSGKKYKKCCGQPA